MLSYQIEPFEEIEVQFQCQIQSHELNLAGINFAFARKYGKPTPNNGTKSNIFGAYVKILDMSITNFGSKFSLSNFLRGHTVKQVISINMLMIEEAASLQYLS
ncbi:MAG: hypothetical protein ACXWRU_17815 [Pseudobdellovibrionaceae bacterium]